MRKPVRKAACLPSLRSANMSFVNVRTNRESLERQRYKLERAGIDEDSLFSSYLRKRYAKGNRERCLHKQHEV